MRCICGEALSKEREERYWRSVRPINNLPAQCEPCEKEELKRIQKKWQETRYKPV